MTWFNKKSKKVKDLSADELRDAYRSTMKIDREVVERNDYERRMRESQRAMSASEVQRAYQDALDYGSGAYKVDSNGNKERISLQDYTSDRISLRPGETFVTGCGSREGRDGDSKGVSDNDPNTAFKRRKKGKE